MARPQRIQYEKAFYHVMNRGRGRQAIFHDDHYYLAYLKTIEEAHSRFDAQIHAYCLMSNHYHLLIQTPRGNLDRIMRHINGLYTQRYNQLKKTDGPLFRGRYKAILVDRDAYLLQLSRYIHLNPIETQRPMVKQLADYPWSSYPAYLNKTKPESWLYRDQTYEMLGHRNKYTAYQSYVETTVDDDIKQFYSKGNLPSCLGDKSFRKTVARKKATLTTKTEITHLLSERPTAEEIIAATANAFNVTTAQIVNRKGGRQIANFPRKVAIYYCQQWGDLSLQAIAEKFGFNHQGSVSPAISDVKVAIKDGKITKEIEKLGGCLNIIK